MRRLCWTRTAKRRRALLQSSVPDSSCLAARARAAPRPRRSPGHPPPATSRRSPRSPATGSDRWGQVYTSHCLGLRWAWCVAWSHVYTTHSLTRLLGPLARQKLLHARRLGCPLAFRQARGILRTEVGRCHGRRDSHASRPISAASAPRPSPTRCVGRSHSLARPAACADCAACWARARSEVCRPARFSDLFSAPSHLWPSPAAMGEAGSGRSCRRRGRLAAQGDVRGGNRLPCSAAASLRPVQRGVRSLRPKAKPEPWATGIRLEPAAYLAGPGGAMAPAR